MDRGAWKATVVHWVTKLDMMVLRFMDYAKVFDCVDHNKLWEILKEMGTPD